MSCSDRGYGDMFVDAFLASPGSSAFGLIYVLDDLVSDVRKDIFAGLWIFGSANVDTNRNQEVVILAASQYRSKEVSYILTRGPLLFHSSKTSAISSYSIFRHLFMMNQTSHNVDIIPCSIPLCTILT